MIQQSHVFGGKKMISVGCEVCPRHVLLPMQAIKSAIDLVASFGWSLKKNDDRCPDHSPDRIAKMNGLAQMIKTNESIAREEDSPRKRRRFK